jgi:hypothetical protein
MTDLAKLVIKRFPENRNMQLVGLRIPASFHCSRCTKIQRAKVLAVVSQDWERLLCSACYEKVLSEPPEEKLADSIPREWLGSAVPVEDVEEANSVDGVPFGNRGVEWKAFKAAMTEGDEICCFCSPPDSREDLAGRGGYALVRQGEVVKYIVTMMN